MLTWEFGVSCVAGVAAVATDLSHRRIGNGIPVFSLVAGLILQGISSGWAGLGRGVAGAACGFSVFLIFYLLGGMGGGDIKLMAGFGAILGPGELWLAAWWAAILGALMALGALLWRRCQGQEAASIPYAPAIVGGVWIVLGTQG